MSSIMDAWQIAKDIHKDISKTVSREEFQKLEATTNLMMRMLRELYADNIKIRLLQGYKAVDNNDADHTLKEQLKELQEDMTLYLEAGGNGRLHELYYRFGDRVQEKLGEEYFMILMLQGETEDEFAKQRKERQKTSD